MSQPTEKPEPFRNTLAYVYTHLLALTGAVFLGLVVAHYSAADSAGLAITVLLYGLAVFIEG